MTRPIMADLVEETTETVGTSDFVLEGAKANRQAFSVLGATAAEVPYRVDFGSEWAIYVGSYTDATKTLTRDAVLASSAGGSEVSFSAGVKSVLLVAPADFLNKLAGHGIPSPAGDASTPGVSIGEDGSGVFYLDGSPSGSKALCFAIDTNHNARFYHAADRKAFSLGWTFATQLPGYIASGHQYTGTVVHLYDPEDAHLILQSKTVGVVMRSFDTFGETYRIQVSGATFSLDKIYVASGAVDKPIFSTNGSVLTVGTTEGVAAANLVQSNPTNAHVGFNAGLNLSPIDSQYNLAAGYLTLDTVDNVFYCTAIGGQAMQYSDQVTENGFYLARITAAGALSARYHHGADTVAVGYRAVGGTSSTTNSTGARHVGIGSDSLNQLTTGAEDTCVGFGTGNQLTTGSGVVYVGCRAGEHLGNVSDRLAIGNGPTAAECWLVGDAAYNVTIQGQLTAGGLTYPTNASGSVGQVLGKTADGTVGFVSGGNQITFGFKISNNTTDAEHDLDIAAGACFSYDKSTWIEGTAQTKRFDAAWAAGTGNGGMDTGALPAGGGLYIYAIYHPENGVDYIGSIADPPTGPALPSGYTKYAYIGYWSTDASSNFEPLHQVRNYFERIHKTITTTDTNPGTSPVTKTIPAPMRSLVDLHLYFSHSGTNLLDIVHGDYTPAAGTPTGNIRMTNGSGNEQAVFRIGLNDSRQIKYDTTASDGSTIVQTRINGWFDMMLDPNLGM